MSDLQEKAASSPVASSGGLNSTDNAYKFELDGEKSSNNFL